MADKHRVDEIQNQIYEFMTIFVVVGRAKQQKDDTLERDRIQCGMMIMLMMLIHATGKGLK